MFIVSNYWRGSMNINDMRGFEKKEDAKAYWDKLLLEHEGQVRWVRAYKLSPDKPPKLLNCEKHWNEA